MAVETEKKKHKWIKGVTEHMDKGSFSGKAKEAGESTLTYAHEHEHDGGHLGKQAVLAENLMKAGHHRAHQVHKASASHKTIRQSMYGHKE